MLRVIKALLGIALIMVGPMLIVITVDDTVFLKNILLRIIGGLCVLLAFIYYIDSFIRIHTQVNPRAPNKEHLGLLNI